MTPVAPAPRAQATRAVPKMFSTGCCSLSRRNAPVSASFSRSALASCWAAASHDLCSAGDTSGARLALYDHSVFPREFSERMATV